MNMTMHGGTFSFIHLCVLVYEGECIGHIVVAQVNNAGTNPRSQLPLRAMENFVHVFSYRRRRLHPVQALPGVPEGVVIVAVEQVLLRQAPELEHVVLDFSPQRQSLQAILELLTVGM